MPLFVVAGPTASGKTEIAVKIAKRLDGEIVGADSMQVYRGMRIGTAAPSSEELDGVPHHMIGIVDPDRPYDAVVYARDADRVIEGIAARSRRAIVAGGTGLYIRVLLRGLQGGPPPDPRLRERISQRAERDGWPALHRELAAIDPPTAERLHPNDGVRILRALEVAEQSGVALSEWQRRHRFGERRYPARICAVDREREDLDRRIARRVELMMERGFLDEVRGLLARGYDPSLKPLQGLGYRRICQHLAGELSLAEAVEKTRVDTRRLARRQRTWLRGESGVEWIAPDEAEWIRRARSFFESESEPPR
ncbi:MAG: tRNA (adenosine(37)-N6)-dimethylallyltransferase MiaA [Polyangia bacterium]